MKAASPNHSHKASQPFANFVYFGVKPFCVTGQFPFLQPVSDLAKTRTKRSCFLPERKNDLIHMTPEPTASVAFAQFVVPKLQVSTGKVWTKISGRGNK
jgi:hypothetical protein